MKSTFVICFASLILFISSCKKDTMVTQVATTKNNASTAISYINLQVGNYWVYNIYDLDSAGVETLTNQTDSLYITKDTVVGAKTYYLFRHSNPNFIGASTMPLADNWVTDSVGFILNIGHFTYLDPVHLNDTIQKNTMYAAVLNIIPTSFTNAVVPAGVFSGVVMNTMISFTNGNPFNGKTAYSKYATGVGLVHYKVGFYSQPKSGYAWELLRYHI